MDEFEPELKRRLQARASAIPVDDDWDDLLNRSVSTARRTNKTLALALVAVVCGASIAVVVAARGSDPSSTRTGVPVAGLTRTGAQVPTIAPQIAPVTEFGKVVTEIRTLPGPGVPSTPLIATFTGDPSSPMAHVFTRTTPNGATIRTYRANFNRESWVGGPPWWTAPGWCNPNGMVQADVSDNSIAGVGLGAMYAETKSETGLGGTTTIVGVAEQHPTWVVVAQAPADAAKVRAQFPGGATDEMEPVDGVAVLVGAGPADGTKTVTLQKLDASGAVTGSVDVAGNGSWIETSLTTNECLAPTTLPPAGKKQPANPAAARQAVIDLFNAAHTKGIGGEAFKSYFDDSHGFDEALAELNRGTFKDQVAAAQMKFKDLAFLDATTAAIQYDIEVPGYSTFSNRFSEAKLIDGKWKLTRAGWCNDVAMAGVSCPD